MNVKYRVTLRASERAQLAAMVLGGKGAFRRLKRAQILLARTRSARRRDAQADVAGEVGTKSRLAFPLTAL